MPSGRGGKVVMSHPEDDLLTYKVYFADPHILPHSDWFSKAQVELWPEGEAAERTIIEAENAAEAAAANKKADDAAAKKAAEEAVAAEKEADEAAAKEAAL